jgi:hypothetical protein
MVTIVNTKPWLQTFNLDHESCCRPDACLCESHTYVKMDRMPGTGNWAPRTVDTRTCRSVMVPARERVSGLPDCAKNAREVQRARGLGLITLIEE